MVEWIFKMIFQKCRNVLHIYCKQTICLNLLQEDILRENILYQKSIKMNKSSIDELKQAVESRLVTQDVAHKAFLRPIEILLNTNKVDSRVEIGQLPQGLRVAVKWQSINDNSYQPTSIPPLISTSFKEIKQFNQDNLISFLKSGGVPVQVSAVTLQNMKKGEQMIELKLIEKEMQLLVCVCMYSESKQMLKDTIRGIEDNVAMMISQGMNPDKVAVVVIMDGIEKVDQSVISYFDELQRESYIFIGEDSDAAYTLNDIERQNQNLSKSDFGVSGYANKNMNEFIFDGQELADRKQRRFQNVLAEYNEVKKLKQMLKDLKAEIKKEGSIYDKLTGKIINDFYAKEAREYSIKYAKSEEERNVYKIMSESDIVDLYKDDHQRSRIIAIEAINKAGMHAEKYMSSRSTLSYLASFRKRIVLPVKKQTIVGELIQQAEQISRQMNLFMCIKYQNGGKLSSHSWFFNGFCKQLNPKYSILLDVGLKPEKSALFKMYDYMKRNPKVGGVCGYMSLKIERLEEEEQINSEEVDWMSQLVFNFVDIQKAQQMEYHLGHILDKAFQGAFGFINVLPGAFSAYNMKALKSNDGQGDKLLKQYFKSIDDKINQDEIMKSQYTLGQTVLRIFFPDFVFQWLVGIDPNSEEQMLYNQNINLAEDRILCMQIHKNGYDLKFIPDAYAEVDPIKTVHGLMGQRKRWTNGSFFAFDKVKKQLQNYQKESGTCQLALKVQIFFLNFMNMLGYFGVSIFFFTLHISMMEFQSQVLAQILQSVANNSQATNLILDYFVYTIDFVYALLIGAVIFYSINTPANSPLFKPKLYLASTLFGLFAFAIFVVFLVDIINGLANFSSFLSDSNDSIRNLPGGKTLLILQRAITIGLMGIYCVPVIIYSIIYKNMKPAVELAKDAFSFVFYSPTYFIIINIYALCRIDDISWGTKGLDSGNVKIGCLQQKWKMIKLIHVAKFLIWNTVASVLLLSFASSSVVKFYLTLILMGLIVSSLVIKIVIGTIYLLAHKLLQCCNEGDNSRVLVQSSMKQTSQPLMKQLKEEINMKMWLIDEIYSKIESAKLYKKGTYVMAVQQYRNDPRIKAQQLLKFVAENSFRSKSLRRSFDMRSKRMSKNLSRKMQSIQQEKFQE